MIEEIVIALKANLITIEEARFLVFEYFRKHYQVVIEGLASAKSLTDESQSLTDESHREW